MGSLGRIICGCLLLGLVPAWVQAEEAVTPEQIRRAVAEVYRYEFGSSRSALAVVEQIVAQTRDRSELRDYAAGELSRLLLSDATLAAKDFACRQLHSIQMRTLSPGLLELLRHETTVEMACYALVNQESEEVNPALRQALGPLEGQPLVAVLNLLGDRRDAGSVEAVTSYVEASSAAVADVAIAALGKIASDQASRLLRRMRTGADSPRRKAAAMAYLQAGRELASRGETERARRIYDELIEEEQLLHVRRGALLGKIALRGSEAVSLILAVLEGDDDLLKPAALAAVSTIPGQNVSSLLAPRLNTLPAEEKTLLIQALTDRGDRTIVPVLVQSLESDSPPVEIAALRALGTLGGASEVALMASRLASTDESVAAAAAAALRATTAPGTNAAMIEIARSAPQAVQVELIEVLSDRHATEVAADMLQLARSQDVTCSRAALGALGKLASFHEMSRLLDVLVSREGQASPVQALRAITAVIVRDDRHRNDIARLIQERLDRAVGSRACCSLLQLLSTVPNASSLHRLRAASEEDSDPSVRDAAIRTLARYPDPAAIEALLHIFQTSARNAHRAVALRGCVRLLKAHTIPAEQATEVYEQLVAHATSVAEKKLILSGLATVQHPLALGLIKNFMDDDAVKAEAALALDAMANNVSVRVDFNDEATALDGKTVGAKLVDSPIAGKALSLNGAEARIELPRTEAWSVGSGDFGVALWVCPESLKQAGVLCVGGYNWRHGWLIDVHPDGSVRLETSNANHENNGSVRTPGRMLARGRWTHLTVVVSRADDARIFVNGCEKAKGQVGAVDLTNRDANVIIGGIENKNQYNFHGHIDEVVICKRRLTEDEIQALVEPGQEVLAAKPNPVKPTEQRSPVVGTWEFAGKTDQRNLLGLLKIRDAESGTYTVGDKEVDLDELIVDGKQVTFSVTSLLDGHEFPTQFRGAVEGSTLKGRWTTSEGSRDVEGIRVAALLFDGKTFAGWEGELEFFRIEQGAIVAGSLDKPIPYNAFLATTREYGDFELKLKAKLTGQGDNAGIQFRSRCIPGSHEMIGYQADMGHNAGDNIWACLYDESRRRRFLAEPIETEVAKVFHADDWNEFTIRCVGHRVQIWLNGYHAVDYTESDRDIEPRGMIGLQIHGGAPSEAWYKDIAITEL